MNPFGDLGDENLDQMRKYLKFFRQKQDAMMRTLAREFVDAKTDRLQEDMFSKEDVEEYSEFVASAVKVAHLLAGRWLLLQLSMTGWRSTRDVATCQWSSRRRDPVLTPPATYLLCI